MSEIPKGNWFCPTCENRSSSKKKKSPNKTSPKKEKALKSDPDFESERLSPSPTKKVDKLAGACPVHKKAKKRCPAGCQGRKGSCLGICLHGIDSIIFNSKAKSPKTPKEKKSPKSTVTVAIQTISPKEETLKPLPVLDAKLFGNGRIINNNYYEEEDYLSPQGLKKEDRVNCLVEAKLVTNSFHRTLSSRRKK